MSGPGVDALTRARWLVLAAVLGGAVAEIAAMPEDELRAVAAVLADMLAGLIPLTAEEFAVLMAGWTERLTEIERRLGR